MADSPTPVLPFPQRPQPPATPDPLDTFVVAVMEMRLLCSELIDNHAKLKRVTPHDSDPAS